MTKMMKRTTTFTRGSGCYTCTSCGRKTRDDGHGDSVHLRLCTECFEVGGLENELQDYAGTPGFDEAECKASIARLEAQIVAKGGKLS